MAAGGRREGLMRAGRIGSVCVALAAVSLAIGLGLEGKWMWGLLVLAPGGLWLLGYRLGLEWGVSAGLIAFAGAAAAGTWLELGPGWMLAGLVLALCAWDLHRFALRMAAAGRIEEEDALVRRHLLRLLPVAGLGLLLPALASGIRIRLTFLPAALLGGLAVWGLSRMVNLMRRESD